MPHRLPQLRLSIALAVLLCAAGLLVCSSGVSADDAEADTNEKKRKIISPDDAVAHATEEVTVEFTVKNSNRISDRNGRPVVFLNSMKNYRDEKNFTVVIFSDALADLRKEKIESPSKYYRDKKVRVSGGIELRSGKAQIILKKPEQIKVVEEKEDATGQKKAA